LLVWDWGGGEGGGGVRDEQASVDCCSRWAKSLNDVCFEQHQQS